MLFSPSVLSFDVQSFLESQSGPLKHYSEDIEGETWTAADIVEYNAFLFGINPQVILITLEASDNLLTNSNAEVLAHEPTNLEQVNKNNFYYYVNQLTNELLSAYNHRRLYPTSNQIEFTDGGTVSAPPKVNAGTFAIQSTLAQLTTRDEWNKWTQSEEPFFRQKFIELFGNPLTDPDSMRTNIINALPAGYQLPFPVGETWYFTGGPHTYSSSGARPWSSVDLAQPEILPCPNSNYPSHRWIVAAKNGNVVQSSQALVVIDHGDGWRTYYSHVATPDRRSLGWINQGDRIGHPSCEVEPGGSTSGIHVHFAIWRAGVGFVDISGSSLSDWLIQETTYYNGTMTRNGTVRTATTGRHNGTNDILNSGGGNSCSAPVLVYPGDGQTVTDRRVTLDWNAPDCSGLTGYTLHVTTGAGPEEGIIKDTGVGPTEYIVN